MASPTIISSIIVPASPWFDGGKPHDLVSLGAVKDHIVSDDDDGAKLDGFLKAAITQASDAIRRYCNRVFQLQLYNVQFWAARDAYPWELPGGFMPLQLPHYPIAGSRSLAAAAPPPSAPVLSAVGGGSVSAANYFVRFTYVTPTGETAASLESNLIVAASNLLMVAAPSPDRLAQATGWNVYVGTESGQEIRQNVSPLALGQSWTLPTSGAFTIANGSNLTLPQYILALENVPNVNAGNVPTALCEGLDFQADRDVGQLTRFFADGYPRRWPALPIVVQLWAGFSKDAVPPSAQDACMRLVRRAYYERQRDPQLRSENVPGAWEAEYWYANGPGAEGNFPPDVQNLLDDLRVPVIA